MYLVLIYQYSYWVNYSVCHLFMFNCSAVLVNAKEKKIKVLIDFSHPVFFCLFGFVFHNTQSHGYITVRLNKTHLKLPELNIPWIFVMPIMLHILSVMHRTKNLISSAGLNKAKVVTNFAYLSSYIPGPWACNNYSTVHNITLQL